MDSKRAVLLEDEVLEAGQMGGIYVTVLSLEGETFLVLR